MAQHKESACNARSTGSIPGWGRSPGRGNGDPLQYSCLENLMDRGTWWAPVHGVAKSWTRLSEHMHTHQGLIIVLLLFLRDLHLVAFSTHWECVLFYIGLCLHLCEAHQWLLRAWLSIRLGCELLLDITSLIAMRLTFSHMVLILSSR